MGEFGHLKQRGIKNTTIMPSILSFTDLAYFISINNDLKEVGPLTAKLSLINLMKYGIVQFLLFELIEESPNCMYAKHSLFKINLLEQKAYAFVHFSDLATNLHFCTLISVNISIPPPLDPKIFN